MVYLCFYQSLEMKKPKTIETLILPEEVIHHIQSFMSGKEAARSAILSKSWYASWLTRPTIDLDERDFGRDAHQVFEEFSPKWQVVFEEFAKKTMQRYQTLNLKIERFRLHTYIHSKERSDVAHELIANAIKIGATHLQLLMDWALTLPQEVLRSETLLKLSLSGCTVYGCAINCSSLKSLTLRHVNFFYADHVLMDIISCCISIEELSLTSLDGIRLGQSIELHKLRRLSLCAVKVDTMFFTNFASRFPCLKDLTIDNCTGCTKIHIATTSLQTISFRLRTKSQRAKFDVPNIRKFTLWSCSLPTQLSINGASSWEWALDISIVGSDFSESSWFMNLKKLLNKFRLSRISLFIDLRVAKHRITDSDHAVEVVPKPLVVENLTIAAPRTFCCTLLRSFGVFHPKFITLHESYSSDRSMLHKVEAIDTFSNRLIRALCVSNWPDMLEQYGLKKVNLQIRDEFDTEWRPLQLQKALTDSEAKVRLQLIWDD